MLPLKWHGGKHYLASRIIDLMPPHLHYVEPYAGGLAVLLAKDPEGVSEVVNDIDGALTDFWRVLADPDMFPDFIRRAQATPFSEQGWREADDPRCTATDAVSQALGFFVRCRQSLAGRREDFAPLSRSRVRRGMSEQASAWLTAVAGLPEVHARLKRVVILSRDAVEVIASQDGPRTLFYCDPPYLPETRTSPDVYAHEMTRAQHEELLSLLACIKGSFLLSGYRSVLYDSWAGAYGWHRTDFTRPNNAASGPTKRTMTECVWSNNELRAAEVD